MITEAQKQEFLERRAKGPQLTDGEVEEFNKTGVKMTSEQYLKFLEATDSKCDGNS